MSTPIEDIHAQDFDDADELTENNNPLAVAQQCSHIVGQKGESLQRIPKSWFYGPGQYPSQMELSGSKIYIAGTGTHHLDSSAEIWIDSVGAQKYVVGGTLKLQINSAFDNARWYTQIQTYPPGAGRYMYADGFVEWSMARFKDSIRPIPPEISRKKAKPKQYRQAGKVRYGFIVEESPSEIVAVMSNDYGEEERGIDVVALCALQQAQIDALEKRVEALEKNAVGSAPRL